MFDFKGTAKKATSDSVVMDGREKAMLETLALAYPSGLTVIMCELAHTTDESGVKEFSRVVFAEEPDKFVNGGSAFTKVVRAWSENFASTEEMNKALSESGGVKVKVSTTRLKNGNNYTVVTVI